jgi:hypothetical protein
MSYQARTGKPAICEGTFEPVARLGEAAAACAPGLRTERVIRRRDGSVLVKGLDVRRTELLALGRAVLTP